MGSESSDHPARARAERSVQCLRKARARVRRGYMSHVLFIDIRKAFDTVPVGALLWKLQNMGFPRRTLAFLKALYTSSSARARAGSLLSDPFPVQRGVRQGCPLSGLLFNLFINDILDGVVPITVPGLPRDTNPIRGLMYADNVAVFADSEQSLLAASTAIEQWADRWEMQFGVAKCGIISFTGHLAPRFDNPLDIQLHGQLVSRVESYKYLGVLIDSKLDPFSMAQAETVCTRAHHLGTSPSVG
ncbi:hypothetical protein BASA60_003414 [Batrachochytrium salamandrivorans]|nr:hypothetical protein BASA60_003414 [Batrachochytrium salamandrivorans]